MMEKKRANELGPTGVRVAENVRELRDRARLSLADLARKLADLGRPLSALALRRIEDAATSQSEESRKPRRVDVDDLMALAFALGVTPNRLLLAEAAGDPQSLDDFHEHFGPEIPLTDEVTMPARFAWRWAAGDSPPPPSYVPTQSRENVGWDSAIPRFQRENRPHDPNRRLTTEDLITYDRQLRPLIEPVVSALKSGVPVGTVVGYVMYLKDRQADPEPLDVAPRAPDSDHDREEELDEIEFRLERKIETGQSEQKLRATQAEIASMLSEALIEQHQIAPIDTEMSDAQKKLDHNYLRHLDRKQKMLERMLNRTHTLLATYPTHASRRRDADR